MMRDARLAALRADAQLGNLDVMVLAPIALAPFADSFLG
jgi:hypothetical protein